MEDFLLPGVLVSAGAAIGGFTAFMFGGTVWIGALIGVAVPFVFLLGFYLALFAIFVGIEDLITGGSK